MSQHLDATETENVAQTMRSAMEAHLPARKLDVNGLTLVDSSADREITDHTAEAVSLAERFAFQPQRRKGTAILGSLDSLILWANRFKGEDSALFMDISDPQRPRLQCVANYHATGAPEHLGDVESLDHHESTARHGDHCALYQFPISRAWTRWKDTSGEKLSVPEFGAFVEDNARDLLDPTAFILNGESPAGDDEDPIGNWEVEARKVAHRLKGEFASVDRMIDLGRSFKVHVESKAKVQTDRQSNRANIVLQEDHTDEEGVKLSLPRLFLIAIPVFELDTPFPMVCTFNYRASGPRLFYTLYDPEHAFETALTEAAERAARETGLPLFYGKPETAA